MSTLESLVATTARPHVERYRSELYPISNSCTARYADMDPNAHLNNLALESLHEDARAVLTRQAFPDTHDPAGRKLRLVTSQNVVHFLAEAYWPARWETERRPEALRYPALADGYAEKIEQTYDWLEQTLDVDAPLDIGHIALATTLSWMAFRDLPSFRDRTKLSVWFDAFEERPSMRATPLSGETHD